MARLVCWETYFLTRNQASPDPSPTDLDLVLRKTAALHVRCEAQARNITRKGCRPIYYRSPHCCLKATPPRQSLAAQACSCGCGIQVSHVLMGTLSLLIQPTLQCFFLFTSFLEQLMLPHGICCHSVNLLKCGAQRWTMAPSIFSWISFTLPFRVPLIFPSFFASMVVLGLTLRMRRLRTEHSQTMSPDTLSSLFPDRPIRPLPKRRLREKLSPETADLIKYPLATHGAVPLFHYPPYTLKEDAGLLRSEPTSPKEHAGADDGLRTNNAERHGILFEETEDDKARIRSTLVSRSPPGILNRPSRPTPRSNQSRQTELIPPPSAASSLDGYDSFENTNNKKKRKIPSAGDSSINGAHSLSSEINALALSTDAASPMLDAHVVDRKFNSSGSYGPPIPYSSGSQGYSGPGRGRLGRSRNGRSPLQALADGNNAWPNRNTNAGPPHWSSGTSYAANLYCHCSSTRQPKRRDIWLPSSYRFVFVPTSSLYDITYFPCFS